MSSFAELSFRALKFEEDSRGRPYDDSTGQTIKLSSGNVSIGIGRNTDANPLSDDEQKYLFINDLSRVLAEARTIFGDEALKSFGERRTLAIVSLLFQLGLSRFLLFKDMIAAIKANDWERAIVEMWHSKMGREARFKNRLTRNERLLRNQEVTEYGV